MADSDDDLFVTQPDGHSESDSRKDYANFTESLDSQSDLEAVVDAAKKEEQASSLDSDTTTLGTHNLQFSVIYPESEAFEFVQKTRMWREWSAFHLVRLTRLSVTETARLSRRRLQTCWPGIIFEFSVMLIRAFSREIWTRLCPFKTGTNERGSRGLSYLAGRLLFSAQGKRSR